MEHLLEHAKNTPESRSSMFFITMDNWVDYNWSSSREDKTHAGEKKESSLLWNQDHCIHGSNALCNFHHISIEQLCRTLSRTNLKEYSIIFSQNIMYADLETCAY